MNYLSREEETSPLSRVLETHRFKHASKLTKIGAEVGRPSLLNRGGATCYRICWYPWCCVHLVTRVCFNLKVNSMQQENTLA